MEGALKVKVIETLGYNTEVLFAILIKKQRRINGFHIIILLIIQKKIILQVRIISGCVLLKKKKKRFCDVNKLNCFRTW